MINEDQLVLDEIYEVIQKNNSGSKYLVRSSNHLSNSFYILINNNNTVGYSNFNGDLSVKKNKAFIGYERITDSNIIRVFEEEEKKKGIKAPSNYTKLVDNYET